MGVKPLPSEVTLMLPGSLLRRPRSPIILALVLLAFALTGGWLLSRPELPLPLAPAEALIPGGSFQMGCGPLEPECDPD